jgi:hypothetical protein
MMARVKPKPMTNPTSKAMTILDTDKSPENLVINLGICTLLIVVF